MSHSLNHVPLSRSQPPLFVGIDVGGTNIKFGMVDDLGQTVGFSTCHTEVEKGPDHGVANVYVDDVYKNTIDLYSDQLLLLQNIYTSADLPFGIHNIRIEVVTSQNVNQKIVSVDAFDVYQD